VPDILHLLVHMGASINEYSPMATSVLQFALNCYPTNESVSIQMVKSLVTIAPEKDSIGEGVGTCLSSSRQYVNHRDILGEALQVAAGEGYTHLVPLLLTAGADVNYYSASDEFQMTPLIGMIFENHYLTEHIGILKMLLSSPSRLDLTHKSNGWTAKQYAEYYERHDIMHLLTLPLSSDAIATITTTT
jgi:hypothetical protein